MFSAVRRAQAALSLAALGACSVVLVACGEKTEQVNSVVDQVKSTATEAIGGGTADCSQGLMATAVKAWAKVQGGGGQATLPGGSDSFKCADGWAVAFPNVGSGENQITVTAVFEAEGPIWVPQDRSKVCGKNSPVPKPLYQEACQTN
jgi:hypothetical protein